LSSTDGELKTDRPRRLNWLRKLGPGLITGASDDDPSGIATYSQVGAKFGYGLGWTLIFSYPLMSAIQEACAMIGRVTGEGLATNIDKTYPRWIAWVVCLALLIANTINVAADLAAMAAAVKLLIGGAQLAYAAILAVISATLIIFVSYERYAAYLKWLCLSLFAYVGTVFVVDLNWASAARELFLPHVALNKDYVTAVVAVFGTTISPYLFFWQASQEAERQLEDPKLAPLKDEPQQARRELPRIKLDTYLGMALSNVIGLFIVFTTSATLHAHGHTDIQTSSEAAEALRPIAGDFAFWVFAAGIIGTGMLGVPVLAGSAAFVLSSVLKWPAGLAKRPREAPLFYGAIAGIFAIALGMTLIGIDPMKALFWSAVINALAAVPIMMLVMLLSRKKDIMGEFTVPPLTAGLGWVATGFMALISLAMVATWIV